MDESAAPWRTLEDARAAPDAGPSSSDPGRRLAIAGPATIGVGTIALIAAAVALWLALSSGHGSLVVEGGGPGVSGPPANGARAGGATEPGHDAVLVVDVQGAVLRPGVVRLAPGSRVADALAAAGGYGPRVAADRVGQELNLAALLKDGDQIVVPSRDDAAAPTGGPGGGTGSSTSGGKVDLNRATVEELDALPGIGPVTAGKIVAARTEQAFASVEDLRTRKILGAATFDKVKDLVTVG
jgi:competence protein ComEA